MVEKKDYSPGKGAILFFCVIDISEVLSKTVELNGKIIGEQIIPTGSITATFTVPYAAGKLVARCYEEDKEIASDTLTTAGKPSKIRLKADRTMIKSR